MLRVLKLASIGVALPVLLVGCSTPSVAPAATTAPVATTAAAQTPAPVRTRAPFRATGNEPSWRLDIGSSELTLLTNFGQTRLVAPTPAAQVAGTTTTYVARTDQGELTATILDQVCVDSMSGMPHPQTVQVVTGGQTLAGCGGEPASLLQGAEWTVAKIDGAPLVAGSQVTLAFAPEGRLSGQSSCNRFMGEYALSGEGLAISRLGGTKMLCDAALMEQEGKFLAALGGAHGFSIAADGALLLRTGDGHVIEARRH
jgi:heat shock protein HslJ